MELRHLRYFTAVVQWKGYREASRRIHVAQPAISQTVADLEEELGLKLFTRAKRIAQLTPEGEVFHAEAVRTLAHAELAIETARRASRGEIGRLSIGFLGSATSAFLPELVRKFKAIYPGVKLTLQELTPVHQDAAFEKGEIDIGFTRTLTAEQNRTFSSRVLYRDPLLAVLPRSRPVKSKRVRIADLANESFVLFHREGYQVCSIRPQPCVRRPAFTRVLKISRICCRRCCRWSKQNRAFPLSLPALETCVQMVSGSTVCNQMMSGSSLSLHGKKRTCPLSFAPFWS